MQSNVDEQPEPDQRYPDDGADGRHRELREQQYQENMEYYKQRTEQEAADKENEMK